MKLSPEESLLIQEKMAHLTRKMLCPIYGMYDTEHGKALGTGVFLNFNQKTWVLTAFQNFIRVKERVNDSNLRFPSGLAYGLPKLAQPQRVANKLLGIQAPENIGVFAVDLPDEGCSTLSAADLSAGESPLENEVLFIQGFPGALEESEAFLRTQSFSGIFPASVLPYASFNPELHLGIKVDTTALIEKMGLQLYPYLEGLRGAPVWALRQATEGQSENARFMGLVQNWDDQTRSLVATRTNVIQTLMDVVTAKI